MLHGRGTTLCLSGDTVEQHSANDVFVSCVGVGKNRIFVLDLEVLRNRLQPVSNLSGFLCRGVESIFGIRQLTL